MTDLSKRPRCDCHGEPMYIDRRTGWRRCAVKARLRVKAYTKANPEKIREKNRGWREANPDKKREENARRLIVCGMYLGMVGFTKREREALLNGAAK